jgi:hypothetical protein
MRTIELNDQQANILRESLEHILSDMSVEIAGTDRKDYREEIKAERKLLRTILAQLGTGSSS